MQPEPAPEPMVEAEPAPERCMICFEGLDTTRGHREDGWCVQPPCGHSFHARCLGTHVRTRCQEKQDRVRRDLEQFCSEMGLGERERQQAFGSPQGVAALQARRRLRQCPQCLYGPVLNTNCSDLGAHDVQRGSGEGRTTNHCPRCQFYSPSWGDWREWTPGDFSCVAGCPLCTGLLVFEGDAGRRLRLAEADLQAAAGVRYARHCQDVFVAVQLFVAFELLRAEEASGRWRRAPVGDASLEGLVLDPEPGARARRLLEGGAALQALLWDDEARTDAPASVSLGQRVLSAARGLLEDPGAGRPLAWRGPGLWREAEEREANPKCVLCGEQIRGKLCGTPGAPLHFGCVRDEPAEGSADAPAPSRDGAQGAPEAPAPGSAALAEEGEGYAGYERLWRARLDVGFLLRPEESLKDSAPGFAPPASVQRLRETVRSYARLCRSEPTGVAVGDALLHMLFEQHFVALEVASRIPPPHPSRAAPATPVLQSIARRAMQDIMRDCCALLPQPTPRGRFPPTGPRLTRDGIGPRDGRGAVHAAMRAAGRAARLYERPAGAASGAAFELLADELLDDEPLVLRHDPGEAAFELLVAVRRELHELRARASAPQCALPIGVVRRALDRHAFGEGPFRPEPAPEGASPAAFGAAHDLEARRLEVEAAHFGFHMRLRRRRRWLVAAGDDDESDEEALLYGRRGRRRVGLPMACAGGVRAAAAGFRRFLRRHAAAWRRTTAFEEEFEV